MELLSVVKATARDYGSCEAPTPQAVIDAYSAVLAVDDKSALEEGGSTAEAPVRLAILDAVDANGDLGGNGAFDEKDVEYYL